MRVLLFLQLAGLVPLVLGIIALVSEETLKKFLDKIPGTEELNEIVDINELIQSFAIAFVVAGAIISVLGIIGGCGACCKADCLLKTVSGSNIAATDEY